MKRVFKIEIFVIFLLIGSMGGVSAIAKDDLRTFLRVELDGYFRGDSTLLTTGELREMLHIYFDSPNTENEIDLVQGGMSLAVQEIVEGGLSLSPVSNEESFSCTVKSTAIETWSQNTEVQKNGYKIKICCKNPVKSSHFLGSDECQEEKYSKCYANKLSGGSRIVDFAKKCSEDFGSEWGFKSPSPFILVGLLNIPSYFQKDCTYTETIREGKTATRTAEETKGGTIPELGNTEEVGSISGPSVRSGGVLSNINYEIDCDNPKINSHVTSGKLYVSLNS